MIVLIPMNYVIETWEWEKLENFHKYEFLAGDTPVIEKIKKNVVLILGKVD